VSDSKIISLYNSALKATEDDKRDDLHTIRYGCAALLTDGQVLTAFQTKLSEYGFTLDPITKLIPTLEMLRKKNVRPVVILQVDQIGILHSPFGPARGHLVEGGYGDATVWVHRRNGGIESSKISDLLPDAPAISESLHSIDGQTQEK